jgi:hypothetical protein
MIDAADPSLRSHPSHENRYLEEAINTIGVQVQVQLCHVTVSLR